MSKTLSPEVVALSAELKKDITIEGVVPSIEKDVYLKNLPAHISKEMAIGVHDYNSVFYPAVTKAFGEVAIDAMAANDEKSMSLKVPLLDKDTWTVSVARSQTFPNPQDTANPVTKFGVITAQLDTYDATKRASDMSLVKKEIGAMALKAFSS